MGVQGSVARCVEGVCVWRKCVGDECGHQRPRYLQVCQGQKICGFCMFFSVNNVLCVPACFHRSCGSAAMCVGYMRVAWDANGRPAKPWKARHVQVNADLCDVVCAYGICGDRALCVCA